MHSRMHSRIDEHTPYKMMHVSQSPLVFSSLKVLCVSLSRMVLVLCSSFRRMILVYRVQNVLNSSFGILRWYCACLLDVLCQCCAGLSGSKCIELVSQSIALNPVLCSSIVLVYEVQKNIHIYHTATHCNTLQHTATHCIALNLVLCSSVVLVYEIQHVLSSSSRVFCSSLRRTVQCSSLWRIVLMYEVQNVLRWVSRVLCLYCACIMHLQCSSLRRIARVYQVLSIRFGMYCVRLLTHCTVLVP